MIKTATRIFGVDVGLYKISGRRFDRDAYGTILVVSRYAFYFFGAIALLLGAAAKIGHYYLYETLSPSYSWLGLGLFAGVVASLPIIIWALWRYWIKKHKARDQSMD